MSQAEINQHQELAELLKSDFIRDFKALQGVLGLVKLSTEDEEQQEKYLEGLDNPPQPKKRMNRGQARDAALDAWLNSVQDVEKQEKNHDLVMNDLPQVEENDDEAIEEPVAEKVSIEKPMEINDLTVRKMLESLEHAPKPEKPHVPVAHHTYLCRISPDDFRLSLVYENPPPRGKIQRSADVIQALGIIVRRANKPCSHIKSILVDLRTAFWLTSNLDPFNFDLAVKLEGIYPVKVCLLISMSILVINYFNAAEDQKQDYKKELYDCITLLAAEISNNDYLIKQVIDKLLKFVAEEEMAKPDTSYARMMRVIRRFNDVLKGLPEDKTTNVTMYFICPEAQSVSVAPYDFGPLTNFGSLSALLSSKLTSGTRTFCIMPNQACRHLSLMQDLNISMTGKNLLLYYLIILRITKLKKHCYYLQYCLQWNLYLYLSLLRKAKS